MPGIPNHPHATLWPSAVVTLGLLHALKGVGNRAFSRWLPQDSRALCPRWPARTRLLRLCMTPPGWTEACLASTTVRGVIDPYGIELLPPRRAGRSLRQVGRQGRSKHRWIVGGTWCLLLHQYGVVVAWDCATAHGPDTPFQGLMRQCDERLIVCSATACHAAAGDPANLTLCPRGPWNDRMRIETGLSMLTLVSHCQQVMHRGWEYCQARRACTMAAFHVLVQWYGLPPDEEGFVPLSIAEFSL